LLQLLDATGAIAARPARAEEITEALGASAGSLGAVGVSHLKVVADEALRGRVAMTTGANTDGVHVRGVNVDRDITVGTWANLRAVAAGEPCVNCGTALDIVRTIEVGHIFKLGHKYTEVLDVTVLGADGGRVTPIMGSYGIGVERALAAIVETHNDDSGIIWPVSVAPFEVAVVPLNLDDEQIRATAESIYDGLAGDRVDVILDDRPGRPGARLKDVELIGIPYRVTIGARGLANGTVEITTRATNETVNVPVGDAVQHIHKLLEAARSQHS
jgi:prolyl-tRNA synthetase